MSTFPTPIERVATELEKHPAKAWEDLLTGLALEAEMRTGRSLRFDGTTGFAGRSAPSFADSSTPRDWAAFAAMAATLGCDEQRAFEQTLTGMALRQAQATGHVLVFHGDPDFPDLAYWEGDRANGRGGAIGPSLLGVLDHLEDTLGDR